MLTTIALLAQEVVEEEEKNPDPPRRRRTHLRRPRVRHRVRVPRVEGVPGAQQDARRTCGEDRGRDGEGGDHPRGSRPGARWSTAGRWRTRARRRTGSSRRRASPRSSSAPTSRDGRRPRRRPRSPGRRRRSAPSATACSPSSARQVGEHRRRARRPGRGPEPRHERARAPDRRVHRPGVGQRERERSRTDVAEQAVIAGYARGAVRRRRGRGRPAARGGRAVRVRALDGASTPSCARPSPTPPCRPSSARRWCATSWVSARTP